MLERHAEPQAHRLDFTASDEGSLTAIVFWHELVLGKLQGTGEDLVLSNSPFSTDQGPTWQQVNQLSPSPLMMLHAVTLPSYNFSFLPGCAVDITYQGFNRRQPADRGQSRHLRNHFQTATPFDPQPQ